MVESQARHRGPGAGQIKSRLRSLWHFNPQIMRYLPSTPTTVCNNTFAPFVTSSGVVCSRGE